jgi:hypothetical protein
LESALKKVVDPKGIIEADLHKGTSYFKTLVNKATMLNDERPCAFDVKDAGDWAIHDLPRFERTYGGERLDEVVHNTRKVLVALYTPADPKQLKA